MSPFLLLHPTSSLAPTWSSCFPLGPQDAYLKTQISPLPCSPCFIGLHPQILNQPTRPVRLRFPLCCGHTGFLELNACRRQTDKENKWARWWVVPASLSMGGRALRNGGDCSRAEHTGSVSPIGDGRQTLRCFLQTTTWDFKYEI